MLKLQLRRHDAPSYRTVAIEFPAPEPDLQGNMKELGIGITTEKLCLVDAVQNDHRGLQALAGTLVNADDDPPPHSFINHHPPAPPPPVLCFDKLKPPQNFPSGMRPRMENLREFFISSIKQNTPAKLTRAVLCQNNLCLCTLL